MKDQPPPTTGSLRVTKKLSPESRGALKLARQYGDALVCVRHRTDDLGEYRYTTVELLVDKVQVQRRIDKIVNLRIEPYERSVRQMVLAAGGVWDHKAKVWCLPHRVAGILQLEDRVIPT